MGLLTILRKPTAISYIKDQFQENYSFYNPQN